MEKRNKTGKRRWKIKLGSAACLALSLLMGGVFGYLWARSMSQIIADTKGLGMVLILLGTVLLGLFLVVYAQTIIHEAGHLLAGWLSGYRFISFRIHSRILVRENGRLKWKRYRLAGTGGQCLMMPPEWQDGKFPCVFYNLGGAAANLAVAAVCFLFSWLCRPAGIPWLFWTGAVVVGIGFAILNGVPMYAGGIVNDGMNALYCFRDRQSRYGFWLTLRANGAESAGTRVGKLPEEWFALPKDLDYSSPLITGIALLAMAYWHDRLDLDRASQVCGFILGYGEDLLPLYRNELRCEELFYAVMLDCPEERLRSMYTKKLEKYIKATGSNIARCRLMYAWELLVEKNQKAAEGWLEKFERAAAVFPYQVEVENEREWLARIRRQAAAESGCPDAFSKPENLNREKEVAL